MSETVILLPGDDITELIGQSTGSSTKAKDVPKVMIGPGLKREDKSRIVVVKCGQLCHKNNTNYWMDSHQKRYIHSKNDRVIGFVVNKQAFTVKVDIGTNEMAILSLLAFPQATKRNKPHIEVGDAVYATVITDCKDIEPELVCVTGDGKKGGMGVLANTGYVLTVPTNIARRLLSPDSQVLKTLGKRYKFEIAVGLNGKIWVNAKSIDTTVTIVNFIQLLEHSPKAQYQQLCDQLVQSF